MTNKTSDKQSSLPLTIENSIQAVARKFGLVPESLRGSASTDGIYINVDSKDGRDSCGRFDVTTLDLAKMVRLRGIAACIAEDELLDGLWELDSQTIFNILFELSDLDVLRFWISVNVREAIREMAHEDRSEFWFLWEEAKLKPAVSLTDKDVETVSPSFSLIKDLQDYEVAAYNLSPKPSLLDLCDGEYDAACEVLLDQCHFDEKKLADVLLQAVVEGEEFSGRVTAEGLVVWNDR